MAKNVQIVPLSGALEFDNGSGGKYLLQITGTNLTISDETDTVLMVFEKAEGSDIPKMNIDNASNPSCYRIPSYLT